MGVPRMPETKNVYRDVVGRLKRRALLVVLDLGARITWN